MKLDRISFVIRVGEVNTRAGQSGIGKSTDSLVAVQSYVKVTVPCLVTRSAFDSYRHYQFSFNFSQAATLDIMSSYEEWNKVEDDDDDELQDTSVRCGDTPCCL